MLKRLKPIPIPDRAPDLQYTIGAAHQLIWWEEMVTAEYYYKSKYNKYAGYSSSQDGDIEEAEAIFKQDGVWYKRYYVINTFDGQEFGQMPGQDLLNMCFKQEVEGKEWVVSNYTPYEEHSAAVEEAKEWLNKYSQYNT